MQNALTKSGFSLVELSIVLVILGLLVGGILGGQSLIRAAELRNITVEYQQLQTAINTFRQKYHAIPGDMPNATRFWGLARPGATGCWSWTPLSEPVSPTGGTATCNGNGNGNLTRATTTVEGLTREESALFWSHLANAGLLSNPYDEYPKAVAVGMRSRLSGAGWIMSTGTSHPTKVAATIMSTPNSISSYADLAILTPEEAWNIDSKMDDGKPFSGTILTLPAIFIGTPYLTHCTVLPDGSPTSLTDITIGNYTTPNYHEQPDAEYNLGHSATACFLIFEQ